MSTQGGKERSDEQPCLSTRSGSGSRLRRRSRFVQHVFQAGWRTVFFLTCNWASSGGRSSKGRGLFSWAWMPTVMSTVTKTSGQRWSGISVKAKQSQQSGCEEGGFHLRQLRVGALCRERQSASSQRPCAAASTATKDTGFLPELASNQSTGYHPRCLGFYQLQLFTDGQIQSQLEGASRKIATLAQSNMCEPTHASAVETPRPPLQPNRPRSLTVSPHEGPLKYGWGIV